MGVQQTSYSKARKAIYLCTSANSVFCGFVGKHEKQKWARRITIFLMSWTRHGRKVVKLVFMHPPTL